MKWQKRHWVEYRKIVSTASNEVGSWQINAWKKKGTRDAWWVQVEVYVWARDEHPQMDLTDERQTEHGGTVADVRHVASLLVESLTERVRRVRGGA